MKIAGRMARLGMESAFDVLAQAKALEAQGKNVIHLEIGEPDFDTPAPIVRAAQEALGQGYTHYNPSQGIPELREYLAAEVSSTRGMDVSPANVVITPGAKPVMFYAISALAEEGDEVIYPDPGFPIYKSMIDFVGAKAVPLVLREENDFGIDVDELRSKITPETTLLILNSPHNPTGGIIRGEQLEQIAALAVEHDLWVLTDEVYWRILYEGEHVSIASFPGMAERTIILDGHSKTYAMTGWRLGFAVLPELLVQHFVKLANNSVSCTATFTQRAALAAGQCDAEIEAMVEEFEARRTMVVDGLNAIEGISCRRPAGAFYAFPNVTRVPMSSDQFARCLLHEHGVATLSGTAFGEAGRGYLRISYAASRENLKEALRRIEGAVKALKG
ncbi:MAG TPA: pyridoxal phosphate-dependent aminotransferase [Chloroflexota bacterium]|nr:pyridoxal phosphate-dependent aminotransferase [Chloroflexota bacterium]